MRAARLLLACLAALLLSAGAAQSYRHCMLANQLCADYDWNGGNAYVDAQTHHAIVGGGVHSGTPYEGYNVHLFAGGTYAYAYDGAWYGDDHTIVAVAVSGQEYVWFYQDTRVTEHPGDHHCTKVWIVYSRCGTGLLP